ncbi:MAG: DUF3800 domain-containing protein [Acidobacteriota bacterium]
MFAYVDESGDPGHKFNNGSSAHFVVGAVIFQTEDARNACARLVSTIRKELTLPPYREFHFNNCNDKIRTHFFERIIAADFMYLTFGLNKSLLTGKGYQFKDSMYKNTVKMLFENAEPLLRDAAVYFDACSGREFQRELKSYLKTRMTRSDGSCVLSRISSQDSKSDNLLQMADMICGAVARSYRSDRKDAWKYRNIIKKKARSERLWP